MPALCWHSFLPDGIDQIDGHSDHKDQQAPEFTGFFDPGFLGLHALDQAFGGMIICPRQDAIVIEEQVKGISAIDEYGGDVERLEILPLVGAETEKGAKKIDRDPNERVGVIVLQPRADDEQDGENEVEDLHG